MSNRAELATDGTLLFWCPGCHEVHGVPTSRWEWDGRLDLPTLKPSIVIRSTRYGPDKLPHPVPDSSETYQQVCHSYVREGRIEFLPDCTHALAGQTVDLPEWDDQPVTLVTFTPGPPRRVEQPGSGDRSADGLDRWYPGDDE